MAQPSVSDAHGSHRLYSPSPSTAECSSSSASETQKEKFFARLFRRVDENGDGKISPAELQYCLRAVGEEMTEEEAKAMVEYADSDRDGFLGFEEFERLVGEEIEGEEGRRRRLKEAFEMYAGEEDGFITPRSLRRTLYRLGEVKTIEDCQSMIQRFDLNGDGLLSFDEFAAMML